MATSSWVRSAVLGRLIILGAVLSSLSKSTDAALTNLWQSTTGIGKWEDASNWSQGVPSLNHGVHFIRPTSGLDNLVTVDAATVASNGVNGCLGISNLTVAGTSGPLGNFATLALNNANNGAGFNTLTILSNVSINARGSLTITNSRMQVGSALLVGDGLQDNGFVMLNTGGELLTTNGYTYIGNNGSGQMRVQDGLFQPGYLAVGNGGQGTLTIAGGTTRILTGLEIGFAASGAGTGTVWLTGGELICTSSVVIAQVSIVSFGGSSGRMIMSNGTLLVQSLTVSGTLTIAGGNTTLTDGILVSSSSASPTGTLWMTGGQFISKTNAYAIVAGGGKMTISNGTWNAGSLFVGLADDFPTEGTVTLAGGDLSVSTKLVIASSSNSVGFVQVTGGQLFATNAPTIIGEGVGSSGTLSVAGSGNAFLGTVTVASDSNTLGNILFSGEQLKAGIVNLAAGVDSHGSLTAAGGLTTVTSNLVVGDCSSNAFGLVRVLGGNLYVTNATHTAVLNVRYGWILHNAGLLAVDKLVITNDCGHFFRSGGTLSVNNLVLDPNLDADLDGLPNGWEQTYGLDPLSSLGADGYEGDPDGDGYNNYDEYLAGSDPRNPLSTPAHITAPPFQITSIQQSNNNIILKWNTAGGLTNQVQVTSGGNGGSYATNGFTNLGPQMLIGGSGVVTTNYTDTNGATNKPARYYRIRLVP